jgi:hypothetical protein
LPKFERIFSNLDGILANLGKLDLPFHVPLLNVKELKKIIFRFERLMSQSPSILLVFLIILFSCLNKKPLIRMIQLACFLKPLATRVFKRMMKSILAGLKYATDS